MGRIIFIILFCFLTLFAADLFDKQCVPCHKKRGIDLKPIFFNYLLYHSSKRRVKKAMKEFLLHPDPKKSLLPKKNKIYRHRFDPKTLDKALDIYWDRYKVIGKIK